MGENSSQTGSRLRPGPGQDPAFVAADQRGRLQDAMTELVYDGSYEDVTVRALLTRAHVTRPTFYRLFAGKEDCFFAAYQQVADEALGWTEAATAGSRDRRDLFERGVGAFCLAFAGRPAAANLALLEPTSVGDDARSRMHRSEDEFADLLCRRFAEHEGESRLPPGVASGLIAGIARVGRRRLDVGKPEVFADDVAPLADWAWALSDVDEMRRFLQRRGGGSAPDAGRREPSRMPEIAAPDERAILINVTTRLAAERGYGDLRLADILAGAGLRRRSFDAHFETVSDCFSAAVELGMAAAGARALNAYRAGPPGPSGFNRAIGSLIDYLATNPDIARLLFVEILVPGRRVTRRGASLLSGFANLLRDYLPKETRPSEAGSEATVGAIWALIRREIEAGRTRALPRLTPLLVWIALGSCAGGPPGSSA